MTTTTTTMIDGSLASPSSSSLPPTSDLLPEDDDDRPATTTTTTTAAATITKVERAHYVLPPAAHRVYVLRCKAPTPFHHGLLGGPSGMRQGLASPPVPSRLVALVDREEDSVRLAFAMSESEL